MKVDRDGKLYDAPLSGRDAFEALLDGVLDRAFERARGKPWRELAPELVQARASLIAAFRTVPEASVIIEIAAERQRQIDVEGWTTRHDDAEHGNRELALAAACFCLIEQAPGYVDKLWPWDIFKDRGPRRNLIRAGALIIAEIERIDRAALANKENAE